MAILITGCSTGIGRATAERLARAGQTVYATARRPDAIADLEAVGCRLAQCDVTDEASMSACVEQVVAAEGAVSALVNNAGYGRDGVVEEVPLDEVRAQFETNVFGLVRMTQLVLPSMRAAKAGRIVNVSSMGGRLVFPGGGFYHATKYAVEALSDALRFEVKPWGIHVSVIEPGPIHSEFAATYTQSDKAFEGPYATFNRSLETSVRSAYEGPMAKLARGPEAVAEAIEKALTAGRPRTRYVVTPAARMLLATRAALPDRAWDAAMGVQFKHQAS